MSNSGWKLYYWGGSVKGRGEYMRLMFALAGVSFEINDPAKIAPLLDRGATIGSYGTSAFPAFAVPLVVSPEGEVLSQTTAIMAFLGKRLGYYPDSEIDQFHALQIACSVADFHAEGRACFHPVDNLASYHDQVEEADKAAKKFSETRLLVWLNHFNHILESNPTRSGFCVGNRLTYCDVTVFYVLLAAEAQFPLAWSGADLPAIKSFMERIKALPAISAHLNSPDAKPFAGNSMM